MIETILKTAGQLLLVGVVLYLALMLYLYWNQGNMIHLPDLPGRQVNATPQLIGLNFEPVTLTTEDGVKLAGWFLPMDKPRATLLFFHGNAGNISHRLDSLQLFHELGLAVFILDYRGYGDSEGKPTEAGLYRDAEAAWRLPDRNPGDSQPRDPAVRPLPGRCSGGLSGGTSCGLRIWCWNPPSLRFRIWRRNSIPGCRPASWPATSTLPAAAAAYRDAGAGHSQPGGRDHPLLPGPCALPAGPATESLLPIHGSHNTGIFESWSSYRIGWDEFIHFCIEHQGQVG